MMELDEAIKHAEEVANEKERLGAMGRGNPDKYAPSPEQCFKCAEEHRQLVAWLKELKELREQKRPHGECKTCKHFVKGGLDGKTYVCEHPDIVLDDHFDYACIEMNEDDFCSRYVPREGDPDDRA